MTRPRPRQRGSTLVFALIALAALALAALAAVHATDTGASVLGNIGLKQEALAGAEIGIDDAMGWLQSNADRLDADASAYLAAAPAALDATGGQLPDDATRTLVDWDGNGCRGGARAACVQPSAPQPVAASRPGGPSYQYLITRLCSRALAPDDERNSCRRVAAQAGLYSPDHGSQDANRVAEEEALGPVYYRIVVRVDGARETASFVDALVHF